MHAENRKRDGSGTREKREKLYDNGCGWGAATSPLENSKGENDKNKKLRIEKYALFDFKRWERRARKKKIECGDTKMNAKRAHGWKNSEVLEVERSRAVPGPPCLDGWRKNA